MSGGAITSCSATGLALGASGDLVVGCGNSNTQTIVLNPSGTGSIVKTLAQISGGDEIWYDPTLQDFFVTGTSGGGRVFDVISDASFDILQSVPLPGVNAHCVRQTPGAAPMGRFFLTRRTSPRSPHWAVARRQRQFLEKSNSKRLVILAVYD